MARNVAQRVGNLWKQNVVIDNRGGAGGTIGATTAKSLDQSVKLIDEWGEAARRVRKDVIVIAHGGPISSPEDVAHVLRHSRHCNGFYGASSMERLPTEIAIKSHVERYKQVTF